MTHLRFGAILYDHFIANFLQSLKVNEIFKNRSIFGEAMDKSTVSHFLTHGVQLTCRVTYLVTDLLTHLRITNLLTQLLHYLLKITLLTY